MFFLLDINFFLFSLIFLGFTNLVTLFLISFLLLLLFKNLNKLRLTTQISFWSLGMIFLLQSLNNPNFFFQKHVVIKKIKFVCFALFIFELKICCFYKRRFLKDSLEKSLYSFGIYHCIL